MATFYFSGYFTSGDTQWSLLAVPYTGSFVFSGQPADGDTVSMYGYTFEFDDDESYSGIPVTIGATLADTLSNLVAAIESSGLGFSNDAYPGVLAATADSVTITILPGGEFGSSMSASSSVITANDFAGGTYGNWYEALDENGVPDWTTAYTSLPTSSDNVIAVSSVEGDGSTVANFTLQDPYATSPTFSGALTVTGVATFLGNYSYPRNEGTITGNAVFGSTDFSEAINGESGVINGNATFHGFYSANLGAIYGNAVFNDALNGDIWSAVTSATLVFVQGAAEFNGSAKQASGNTYNGMPDYSCLIDGGATFNDNSAVIGGYCNAVFNDNATLGLNYGEYQDAWGIVENAVFNDNSLITKNANYNLGATFPVFGSATFRGNARNECGIGGGVILAYEKGINGSSILGII